MTENQPPSLKRGLFGYTRSSVRRMLADRDSMFAMARGRLTQTQARVGQLEAQLTTLEQHLNLRNAEVEGAAQKIAQLELELDGARERLRESESLSTELAQAREALGQMDALSLELAGARERLAQLDSLTAELEEARERLAGLDSLTAELTEARERLRDRDRLDEELRETRARLEGVSGELEQARRRLREQEQVTESRIAAVEWQLAGTRTDLEQQARAAEIRATQAEAELAASRAGLTSKPEVPSPVEASEQITAIIEASERAASRIIDVAGKAHQEQAEQIDRMREEVREEAERLSAWRRQLDPIARSIRISIDRARAKIEDIPDRIRDALSPLGEAFDSVNDQLTTLVEEAAESAPRDEDEPDRPAVEDEEQDEGVRADEHASPIRAIHLDEPEPARPGDANDDPESRPGWHHR